MEGTIQEIYLTCGHCGDEWWEMPPEITIVEDVILCPLCASRLEFVEIEGIGMVMCGE